MKNKTKTSSVVLFKNDSKTENAPLYSGIVKIEGEQDLKAAAWLQYSKANKPYLSLTVRSDEAKWYGAIFKNDTEYNGLININEDEKINFDSVIKRFSKNGIEMLICEIAFDFAIEKPKQKAKSKPANKRTHEEDDIPF